MTPDQLARLTQLEKEKAAAHEASHATVAAVRGACVEAWIHRNDSQDPDDKAWLGHVLTMPRVDWNRGPPVVMDESAALDAVFAVAGIVAEEFYDNPGVEPEQVMEAWEEGANTPSAADLSLCPEDWRGRSRAVRGAVNILRTHKALFDQITAELLESESLGPHRIAELTAQFSPEPPACRRGPPAKKGRRKRGEG